MRLVSLGGLSAKTTQRPLVHALGPGARVRALCGVQPSGESRGWLDTEADRPTCLECLPKWELIRAVAAAGRQGYVPTARGQRVALRALQQAGYLRLVTRRGRDCWLPRGAA